MATLPFSVYRRGAPARDVSTQHAVDAAIIVAVWGDGSVIRCGRTVVWVEGSERFSAADSYDAAADVMAARLKRVVQGEWKRRYPNRDYPSGYVPVGDTVEALGFPVSTVAPKIPSRNLDNPRSW